MLKRQCSRWWFASTAFPLIAVRQIVPHGQVYYPKYAARVRSGLWRVLSTSVHLQRIGESLCHLEVLQTMASG